MGPEGGIGKNVHQQRMLRREAGPIPVTYEIENIESFKKAHRGVVLIPGENRIRIVLGGKIYIRSFHEKPLNENVQLIRWSSPETIESGILSLEHIEGVYHPDTGGEIQKLLLAKQEAEKTMQGLLNGEINRDTVLSALVDVAEVVVSTGLSNAKKVNKKRIAQRMIDALSPDIRQRFNQQKGVLQDQHAIEDIEDELIFSELPYSKNKLLAYLLRLYRTKQRNMIEDMNKQIEFILGLPDNDKEFYSAVRILSEKVSSEFGPFSRFTTPYSSGVAISRLLINGITTEFDNTQLLEFMTQDYIDTVNSTQPASKLRSSKLVKSKLEQSRAELQDRLDEGAFALGEKEHLDPSIIF